MHKIHLENKRKKFLLNQLRNVSKKWSCKAEARKRFEVKEGEYYIERKGRHRIKIKCAHCGNIFRPDEIHMDHIEPVIPVTGWDDWNGYIERLFCDVDGYQALCKQCHVNKSNKENKLR